MKPPHIKYRPIAEQMRNLLNLPNAEIAARLGCKVDTVQENRRRIANGFVPKEKTWTDARDAKLKDLHAAGHSSSRIAGIISADGGKPVTRNAVIGRVHRLGLPLAGRWHDKPVRVPRKRTPLRKARESHNIASNQTASLRSLYLVPDGYVPPAEELVIPLHERKTVLTLAEQDCRWPIGEPGHPDFHFCGKKKIPGLPYCEHHSRRAFQPPQARRREQFVPRVVEKDPVAA